nr:hypothetical protein GCM10017611_44910 [Rhodococcus wratislaviensis]
MGSEIGIARSIPAEIELERCLNMVRMLHQLPQALFACERKPRDGRAARQRTHTSYVTKR